MERSADFSPCRTWRYSLSRDWGSGPRLVVIGLNPSTADEHADDPTIRRCIGFARSWGCGGLHVVNAYALCSTHPRRLDEALDPVGPGNDDALRAAAALPRAIHLAAWGSHCTPERARDVAAMFPALQALRVTAAGAPGHPLYIRASTRPRPWRPSPIVATHDAVARLVDPSALRPADSADLVATRS
jgi:hypothetical protein